MLYSMLIYVDPAQAANGADGSDGEAQHQAWLTYTQGLVDSGAFVAGQALQPVDAATTVRVRDGEVLNTDGPFAETKEILGGFYVIDVDDLDAALALAARTPISERGSVEVRPVMPMD